MNLKNLIVEGIAWGLIRGSAAVWQGATPGERKSLLGKWIVDWLMKQSSAIRDEVNRV